MIVMMMMVKLKTLEKRKCCLVFSFPFPSIVHRGVTRTVIGGCLFIHSCSVRRISFEFELISKEIRRA